MPKALRGKMPTLELGRAIPAKNSVITLEKSFIALLFSQPPRKFHFIPICVSAAREGF